MTNEAQIRNLVENWAKAVREHDMPAVMAFHDQDMIMFDVPEPFQSIGIDAYRRTWETFYRYTKLGVFDIQHLAVVAGEDVAFCIATMKCEDNSDGMGFTPLDFRLTIGLKKLTDQWTIVHEHHSIPSK